MFKMFKVGELFDIHPTATYKMKNNELFASDGATPVLSNSSMNNGIGGYCGLAPTEQGEMITFSDTTTGADTMFYQSCPFVGYPHVQGMYPYQPNKWDEKCCLYVISCIRKSAGNGWNYAVKFNRALVKELFVELPVVKSSDLNHEYTVEDIDFEYMKKCISKLEKERIAELERERITELDAYLIAAGLDNYELTDEDKKILSRSPESTDDETGASEADCGNEQVVFKGFKVSDVFSKVEAKCKKENFDKRRDTSTVPNTEYCIPLINAKVGDNGIMFYGRASDWNTQEMCIDVVQNGAVATGTVYAQPQPVGVLWDAYLIKPNTEVKSVEALLYMAKCIEKITKEQFSYDKKATWDRVKVCEINLPVTSDGDIDFDYMERYIRAIEKLTIADVVEYKDRMIAAAKQVINI